MRKRTFRFVSVALLLGAILTGPIQPVSSNATQGSLLQSQVQRAHETLKEIIKRHHNERAVAGMTKAIGNKSANGQKNPSQHNASDTPSSTADNNQAEAAVPKTARTTDKKSPNSDPPVKEDCYIPPPYLLDGPYDGYTHPDIPNVCKTPQPLPKPIQKCPDQWIENRMPGPTERLPHQRQYFIIDGKRQEIINYDLDWILIYCPIDVEYVY